MANVTVAQWSVDLVLNISLGFWILVYAVMYREEKRTGTSMREVSSFYATERGCKEASFYYAVNPDGFCTECNYRQCVACSSGAFCRA